MTPFTTATKREQSLVSVSATFAPLILNTHHLTEVIAILEIIQMYDDHLSSIKRNPDWKPPKTPFAWDYQPSIHGRIKERPAVRLESVKFGSPFQVSVTVNEGWLVILLIVLCFHYKDIKGNVQEIIKDAKTAISIAQIGSETLKTRIEEKYVATMLLIADLGDDVGKRISTQFRGLRHQLLSQQEELKSEVVVIVKEEGERG